MPAAASKKDFPEVAQTKCAGLLIGEYSRQGLDPDWRRKRLSKARYELRSDGLTNQFGSPDNLVLTPEQVTTYNSSLGVAQDAILSVSRLEGELRTFPDTFTETQAITGKLDHMKRFLTGLVDEFEKVRPAQQIRFADLKNP
jgi:hypothetical protein